MEISNFVRFFGPYNDRPGRWVTYGVRRSDGGRSSFFFREEAAAQKTTRIWRTQIEGTPIRSVERAVDDYEKHLRQKGDRESSIREAVRRLQAFFPSLDMLLMHVDEGKARGWNQRILDGTLSVDTKINHLNTAKTFFRWCVDAGMLRANPLAKVKPVGRRNRRKAQLHVDEAHIWLAKAIELAEAAMVIPQDELRAQRWHREIELGGDIAAMLALTMGLRASEIVTRTVRDVDEDGSVLWIAEEERAGFETKTEAGDRRVGIPGFLRPFLDRLTVGKEREGYLFPGRYGHGHLARNGVLFAVRRICAAAGVQRVTTHGMRGLFATLAVDDGAAVVEAVAATLGHASSSTTTEHYAAVGSLDRARARKARAKLGLR